MNVAFPVGHVSLLFVTVSFHGTDQAKLCTLETTERDSKSPGWLAPLPLLLWCLNEMSDKPERRKEGMISKMSSDQKSIQDSF